MAPASRNTGCGARLVRNGSRDGFRHAPAANGTTCR